jgi:hypothetical protein
MGFGSVAIVTRLRAGRFRNLGSISKGRGEVEQTIFSFFLSRPSLWSTQPPVRSTKMRGALWYLRIPAVVHKQKDNCNLYGLG